MTALSKNSKGERFKHEIPYTSFEKLIEIIGMAGIFVNLILLVKYWPRLPNTIATHFDMIGNADGWGSKNTLFIMPIVMIVLYVIMTILSKYPQSFNYLKPITESNSKNQYHNARKMISSLKVEIVIVFSIIQWAAISGDVDHTASVNPIVFLLITPAIFVTIAYYIYKSIKIN